jgi:hypothetical protein
MTSILLLQLIGTAILLIAAAWALLHHLGP